MGNNTSTISKSGLKKIAIDFKLDFELVQKLYTHYTLLIQRKLETPCPWIVEKVFDHLLLNLSENTQDSNQYEFQNYLTCFKAWNTKTVSERVEILFQILDYDTDGLLTPSDLAMFLSHLQPQEKRIQVGDRVRLRNDTRYGLAKYIGKTQFAEGVWVGIELDPLCGQTGRNNGSIDGVDYFSVEKEGMGIFVQYHSVEREADYVKGKSILESFGGPSSGLGKQVFVEKCTADPWLMKRIQS